MNPIHVQRWSVQTSSGALAYFYILSWLFLGAYIFQNLATGVMVSNYQVIRQKMDDQEAKLLEAQQQQTNVEQLVNKVQYSPVLQMEI